ncbi:MAG: phosphopantetheine-binding protein [Verrucomicrobiaceae bacterium]
MNTQEFLTNLETAIDAEAGSIAEDATLSSILEWDSLAVVGYIAMADAKYGKKVLPGRIKECKTVNDLMQLIAAS